jgi:hypothetical protein
MKYHTKCWHLFRGLLPILLGVWAVGGVLLGAQPASALTADVCMQTNYTNHGKTQTLNCTANDVRVAEVTNIDIISGGSCTGSGANRTCTCSEGGTVTFAADYKVELTAQTRYDIGIYFGTDGDSNNDGALTGACKLITIDPSNSSNFVNLDNPNNTNPLPADQCGDIDDAVSPVDHNPQLLHLTLSVACQRGADDKLKLPNCTSWRQPGSNEACRVATDAFPGSPSKCNCQPGFTVGIFVETATIQVDKAADPISVPETGGDVTYTVTVTNLAQQASVTLDSLTDNPYGDITTINHDGITATTCALVTIPAGNVAGQNPYTCQFTVHVAGGDTGQQITDVVTACGTDSFNHPNLCDDGTATVTISDISTPPSLTKTAVSVTPVCATVDADYEVVVTNNSAVDTITLNTLCDNKFGDITGGSNQACGAGPFDTILSTDCSVLVSGQARTIAPSSSYTCSFVGRIPCSLNTPHVDNVTGSLTDDDGKSYSPSDPDGGATVTVTGVDVAF